MSVRTGSGCKLRVFDIRHPVVDTRVGQRQPNNDDSLMMQQAFRERDVLDRCKESDLEFETGRVSGKASRGAADFLPFVGDASFSSPITSQMHAHE